MGTISITVPTPLLDWVRILAPARSLDVETYLLKAITQATLRSIRGWRGDSLIAILRERAASLDAPIAESDLLGRWSTRHPRRTQDFETAILELVADGILLPYQHGYSLSVAGQQLLRVPPG